MGDVANENHSKPQPSCQSKTGARKKGSVDLRLQHRVGVKQSLNVPKSLPQTMEVVEVVEDGP